MPARRRWRRTRRSCGRISAAHADRFAPAGAGDVPAGVSRRRRSRRGAGGAGGGCRSGRRVGRGSLLPPTMEAAGADIRWMGRSATGSSRRWRRFLPGRGRGRSRPAFGQPPGAAGRGGASGDAAVRGGARRRSRRTGGGRRRPRTARGAIPGAARALRGRVADGAGASDGRLLRCSGLFWRWPGRRRRMRCSPGFSTCRRSGAMHGGSTGRCRRRAPGPLPIEAVLPEACAPRRPEALRFDGERLRRRVGGALSGRARGRRDPDRGAGADGDRRAGALRAGAGKGGEPAADGGDAGVHGAGAAGAARGARDLLRARGRPYPARGSTT